MFYENYLNSIKPDMSFIPEGVSYNDMAVFTNRAIQDAYNESIICITGQEISIFESVMHEANEGEEVSTEKKKNLFEIVGKFFKFIWEKIKGFFATVTKNIKELFTRAMISKVKGTAQDFNNAIKALPDDYKTTGNIKIIDNTDDIESYCKEVFNTIIDEVQSIILSNPSDESVTYDKESMKKSLSAINKFKEEKISKIIKSGSEEITKKDIEDRRALINKIVFKDDNWLKVIKECYNDAKKAIDDNMKAFKTIINKAKKGQDVSDAKRKLQLVKNENTVFTAVVSLFNTAKRKIRSNCISIIAKVIVATKTKLTKEDVDITINTDETPKEEFENNNSEEVEVDDIEESFTFDFFKEEDEVEVDDIEATTDDSDEDSVEDVEVDVEESTLYKALVSYLA